MFMFYNNDSHMSLLSTTAYKGGPQGTSFNYRWRFSKKGLKTHYLVNGLTYYLL